MKIYLGYDHAGQSLKEPILQVLKELGHEVKDLGSKGDDNDDYPDFAQKVAEKVQKDPASRGVLMCGTGVGMAMVANKFHGIRAAFADSVELARLGRAHNDANVLTMAGRMTNDEIAKSIVKTFLETSFEGGRHERRVNKITALENKL